MKGTVMRSTGSWYEVLGDDQQLYSCRLRGKFRLDEIKESNPVAVGDQVVIETDQANHVIIEILERKNHILRQSVKKTGHTHVLAANIDQVLMLATLKQPRTSLGFIDRFFATAESFRIPQLLIFNKADLLTAEQEAEVKDILAIYETIGVQTRLVSALHDEDITDLRKLLHQRTTLIAGHSGVGKSTLLNKLSPEIGQAVGRISNFSNKGTHTTTFAEMFRIEEATYIIDTPGVKEWGLADMSEQEISDYFPEFRDLRLSCKFGARCLHLHEPQCAVLKALEEGRVATSRYESYASIVRGDDNRK